MNTYSANNTIHDVHPNLQHTTFDQQTHIANVKRTETNRTHTKRLTPTKVLLNIDIKRGVRRDCFVVKHSINKETQEFNYDGHV
eukprot:m.31075 g.31075  ORF g.31075 m.31075 type:complete len:84 (-) comp16393_c0_seq1:8-259(-)